MDAFDHLLQFGARDALLRLQHSRKRSDAKDANDGGPGALHAHGQAAVPFFDLQWQGPPTFPTPYTQSIPGVFSLIKAKSKAPDEEDLCMDLGNAKRRRVGEKPKGVFALAGNQKGSSPWQSLPIDILCCVCSFLDIPQRARFFPVCPAWLAVAAKPSSWPPTLDLRSKPAQFQMDRWLFERKYARAQPKRLLGDYLSAAKCMDLSRLESWMEFPVFYLSDLSSSVCAQLRQLHCWPVRTNKLLGAQFSGLEKLVISRPEGQLVTLGITDMLKDLPRLEELATDGVSWGFGWTDAEAAAKTSKLKRLAVRFVDLLGLQQLMCLATLRHLEDVQMSGVRGLSMTPGDVNDYTAKYASRGNPVLFPALRVFGLLCDSYIVSNWFEMMAHLHKDVVAFPALRYLTLEDVPFCDYASVCANIFANEFQPSILQYLSVSGLQREYSHGVELSSMCELSSLTELQLSAVVLPLDGYTNALPRLRRLSIDCHKWLREDVSLVGYGTEKVAPELVARILADFISLSAPSLQELWVGNLALSRGACQQLARMGCVVRGGTAPRPLQLDFLEEFWDVPHLARLADMPPLDVVATKPILLQQEQAEVASL